MHNKQFIISKRKVNDERFMCMELKDEYMLCFHKDLKVTTVNDSILLGNAFQGDDSREIPEKELLTMSSPIDTYNTWNGRWVLLYKNEIHPDACAQLGIFYGEISGEIIVSSSLALIAELYKGEYKNSEYMPLEYNLLLSWIPGPFTAIEGINRLLPTQYLIMDEGFEVVFRNPISKTDYSKLTVNEIYNKIYEQQRCAFKYIEKYDFRLKKYSDKKNIFNIGLTAGYDSRMQAVLMKQMCLNMRAHTFERRKSTESADVKYPQIIAGILNIDWQFIPIEKRQAKRVIEYNRHTFDSVKDRDWKWHYTCGQYDKVCGDVIVSSSIWEAFCNYYVSFGLNTSLQDSIEAKYQDLINLFETLEGNTIAEMSFKKYIKWVNANPIEGLSWADRITFEQLMGIWDGNENQGKDLFTKDTFIFNPGNSMEIFALILALPLEKRKNRLWEKEIVDKFAPELESIPYNKTSEKEESIYLFPCADEVRDKNVVLYGAGKVGKAYYMQMTSQNICNVVSWVDIDYANLQRQGLKIDHIKIVEKISFDYLFIAVESKDLYKNIMQNLVIMGVPQDKIMWKEPRKL